MKVRKDEDVEGRGGRLKEKKKRGKKMELKRSRIREKKVRGKLFRRENRHI